MDPIGVPVFAADTVKTQYDELWRENVTNILSKAIEINTILQPHELQLVGKLLNTPIKISDNAIRRQHPFPAICHTVSSTYCRNKLRGENYLEIGNDYFENQQHMIHLLSARDEARARKNEDPRGVLFGGSHCNAGAEKCDKQADNLLMCCVQDIPPEGIPGIMRRHGASRMLATLILPDELDFDENYIREDKGYELVEESDNTIMYFKADGSLAYSHNTRDWKAWRHVTIIQHKAKNYIFEEINKIGIVSVFSITATYTGGTVVRPIHNPWRNHYRILDIASCLDEIFRVLSDTVLDSDVEARIRSVMVGQKGVWVPRTIYDRVVDFAVARTDSMFNRNVVKTFINSSSYEIIINNKAITEACAGLTAEERSWFLLTAFLQAAATRYKETKAISYVMTAFTDFTTPGVLQRILGRCTEPFKRMFRWNKAQWMQNDRRMQIFMECIRPDLGKDIIETGHGEDRAQPKMFVDKDFTYHHGRRGECLKKCVEATTLEKEYRTTTLAGFDNDLDTLFDTDPDIVVNQDHAYLQCNTSTHCRHGIPGKIVNLRNRAVYEPTGETNLEQERVDRYLQNDTTCCTNKTKTESIIEDIKVIDQEPKFYNLCASPGNDHDAWEGKQVVHFVFGAAVNKNLAVDRLGKCREINLCCKKCCAQISEPRHLVADLGLEGRNSEIVATQIQVIKNLLTMPHKTLTIKIQKYYDNILEGTTNTRRLHQLLSNFRETDVKGSAPGEKWFRRSEAELLAYIEDDDQIDDDFSNYQTVDSGDGSDDSGSMRSEAVVNSLRVARWVIQLARNTRANSTIQEDNLSEVQEGRNEDNVQQELAISELEATFEPAARVGEWLEYTTQLQTGPELCAPEETIDDEEQLEVVPGPSGAGLPVPPPASSCSSLSTTFAGAKNPLHYAHEAPFNLDGKFYKNVLQYMRENRDNYVDQIDKLAAIHLTYSPGAWEADDKIKIRGEMQEINCTTDKAGIWIKTIKQLKSVSDRFELPEFAGQVHGQIDGLVWGKADPLERIDLGETAVHMTLNEVKNAVDHLKRTLKTDDAKFAATHSAAIARLNSWKPELVRRKIEGFEGTAGSGKTASLKKLIKPGTEVVVAVAYSSLADDYRKDGYACYTMASFLQRKPETECVIMDEVFSAHPGFFAWCCHHYERVIVLGDRDQLDYNDGSRSVLGIPKMSNIIQNDLPKKRVSLTVPIDCIRWANAAYKLNVKTRNNLLNSVTSTTDRMKKGDANNVTMSSSDKILGYGPTVASLQGKRYRTMNVFTCGSDRRILTVHGMGFVMISRHNHKLIFHNDRIRGNYIPNLAGQKYTRIKLRQVGNRFNVMTPYGPWEVAGGVIESGEKFKTPAIVPKTAKCKLDKQQNVYEEFIVHEKKVTVTEDFLVNMAVLGPEPVGTSVPYHDPEIEEDREIREDLYATTPLQEVPMFMLENEINKISQTQANPFTENRLTDINNLGQVAVGQRVKIAFANTPMNPDKVLKKNISVGRARTRHDETGHFGRTAQCVVVRYAGPSATRDRVRSEELSDKLLEGFLKFVDKDKIQPITYDEFELAVISQIAKIHAKGTDQSNAGLLVDKDALIRFFLKGQQKVDLNEDGWLRKDKRDNLKAGQGVSGLGKVYNHIAGAVVRCCESAITRSFKPGVSLGYGVSKRRLQKVVEQWSETENCKLYEFDLSEQDCSRGLWTDLYLRKLLRMYGVPEHLIDIEIACHTDWRLSAIGLDVKADVKDKYQSGSPWTLESNTLMEMGVVGMSYDFQDFKGALGQGDDMLVAASKATPTQFKHDRLKTAEGEIGAFCGLLFDLKGNMSIDLPRCGAKLLNRTFDSTSDLEEYKTAVQDWLVVHRDCRDQIIGCAINAKYYGTTYMSMATILGGLHSFARGVSIMDLNPYGTSRNDSMIQAYIHSKKLHGV